MRGSQGSEGVPGLLTPLLTLHSSMSDSPHFGLIPSDSPGPDPLFRPSTITQETASQYLVCSEDKNNLTDVSQDLSFLAALNKSSFLQ